MKNPFSALQRNLVFFYFLTTYDLVTVIREGVMTKELLKRVFKPNLQINETHLTYLNTNSKGRARKKNNRNNRNTLPHRKQDAYL